MSAPWFDFIPTLSFNDVGKFSKSNFILFRFFLLRYKIFTDFNLIYCQYVSSPTKKSNLIIFNLLNWLNYLLLFFYWQNHQRTPSQVDISEFKALTKLDALHSLKKELNKLILTAEPDKAEVTLNLVYSN